MNKRKKRFVNGKVITTAFLMLIIMITGGCLNRDDLSIDQTNGSGSNGRNDANTTYKDSLRYLALGDSYTIGQGVSESERWPNQLGEELEDNDYKMLDINIIAQTGWTTGNLLDAIENADLTEYDLVSLLIGVNNQYQNQNFSIFEAEFDSLLNICRTVVDQADRVFVVSIPDYGVTPFGSSNSEQIAEDIDMYNAYISEKCNEQNIPFINITEISRMLGDSEGALAPDNLHPSGSQYRAWVQEILPVVLNMLEQTSKSGP
jgi:lysophospholipase L1-like esterase